MTGLDTNVIIRYLTRDDEANASRCLALLQRAEAGTEDLFICEAVLAEAVYVLSSPRLYGLPRRRVGELLGTIVNLRGVHMPGKAVCRQALDLYARANLDLEYALLVSHLQARGAAAVHSYDRHFDGIGLQRREP